MRRFIPVLVILASLAGASPASACPSKVVYLKVVHRVHGHERVVYRRVHGHWRPVYRRVVSHQACSKVTTHPAAIVPAPASAPPAPASVPPASAPTPSTPAPSNKPLGLVTTLNYSCEPLTLSGCLLKLAAQAIDSNGVVVAPLSGSGHGSFIWSLEDTASHIPPLSVATGDTELNGVAWPTPCGEPEQTSATVCYNITPASPGHVFFGEERFKWVLEPNPKPPPAEKWVPVPEPPLELPTGQVESALRAQVNYMQGEYKGVEYLPGLTFSPLVNLTIPSP